MVYFRERAVIEPLQDSFVYEKVKQFAAETCVMPFFTNSQHFFLSTMFCFDAFILLAWSFNFLCLKLFNTRLLFKALIDHLPPPPPPDDGPAMYLSTPPALPMKVAKSAE